MSTSPEVLTLTADEAALLQSALPHLNARELAEVESLITGTVATGTGSIDMRGASADLFIALANLQADPWQVQLLNSDAKRILLNCSRQSGKSTTAAMMAIIQVVTVPDSLVLLLSLGQRQSGELFRDKVLRHYKAMGSPVRVAQESALQMTLANGSRIVSLPGDEKTIRGYSGVKLLVIDEAAQVPDELYKSVRPMLAVSGGRLIALSTPYGKQGWFYHAWQSDEAWERVRVTAEQCPRIPRDFLAEEMQAMGEYWYSQEYCCEFRDASENPLFPSDWLARANGLHVGLSGRRRDAKAIGCDPAEGGDKTVWAVVDEYGLIFLLSMKTPDTSVIPGQTIALMREYGVPANRVCFDRGGGGKQHADRLRDMGHEVRTVAFGEAVVLELKRGLHKLEARLENREEKYVYANRRAQMYHELSQLMDPAAEGPGFAIPPESDGDVYADLRRQLAPLPKQTDGEGRFWLPPKTKKDPKSNVKTLVEIIGHSPDESDALVLAVHGLLHKARRAMAGAY